MTDAERLAALVKAGITDEQLSALASGRIVLWKDEGVRRDEREACAKIAQDRAAVCQAAYNAGDTREVHPLNEALHIAQLIRARTKE